MLKTGSLVAWEPHVSARHRQVNQSVTCTIKWINKGAEGKKIKKQGKSGIGRVIPLISLSLFSPRQLPIRALVSPKGVDFGLLSPKSKLYQLAQSF